MGDYYRYWGKAGGEEGQEPAYHLLPYHCLDVAAAGCQLLQKRPAECEKLAQMCGMTEREFQSWGIFLLALHDLGKFSFNFQAKRLDLLHILQPDLTRQPLETQGHDTLGWALWDRKVRDQLTASSLLPAKRGRIAPRELNIANRWMRAMCGHHGRPANGSRLPALDDNFSDFDLAAANEFVSDVAGLLLSNVSPLSVEEDTLFQRASWYLAGFAVIADWIGSNENYFPWCSEEVPLDEYWEIANQRAEKAVKEAGMIPAVPAPRRNYEKLIGVDSWEPTPMQKMAQQIPLSPWPQLLIIEDVTGSGKTEAAAMLAHRIMEQHGLSGLYFALPTMATANAMFDRMAKACRNFYMPETNPSLVLAHGARQLSESFANVIARPASITNDQSDTETSSATCSRWLADHRKKALLAEIGVGTIDQALLGVLRSRHQSLRLYGLMQKVLIVDEVHACDSYMNRLLQTLLYFHAAAGGSAILLSATLPRRQRQSLADAFSQGLGLDGCSSLEDERFPLMTRIGIDPTEEQWVESRPEVCRSVKVERLDSENEVTERLVETARQGRCACWVRNTVGDAIAACEAVRAIAPEVDVLLFHARFAMQDRLDIESDVIRRFGPKSGALQRAGRIVIATQVIEQSLDVDFDLLVSDLAPIDLILQRAGRLHRHRRDQFGNRTKGEDQRGMPTLLLLAPPADADADRQWCGRMFEKGQYVYPDHGQLWLTVKLLQEKQGFTMPDDARELIEGVYGDNQQEIPEPLLMKSAEAMAKRKSDSEIAGGNVLNLLDGYGDGEMPWWDDETTPTRLGEKSRTCYLARWDGTALRPWINDGDHRWQRSSVQVRSNRLSEVDIPAEIPVSQLEACRQQLPDKGKWNLLIPLLTGENGWVASGQDAKDGLAVIKYSKEWGLQVESK